MGVVEQADADVEPLAVDIVNALRSFQSEQELAADHLIGALQVALVLGSEGQALAQEVLGDERLFESPESTRRVACLIDRMPDDLVREVAAHVARHFPTDPTTLTEPLGALPATSVAALFDQQEIKDAVVDHYATLASGAPQEADALLETIYEAAQAHGDDAARLLQPLQWTLLTRGTAYPVMRAHAPAVMESIGNSSARDSHALRGLASGPPDDWTFWAGNLSGPPSGPPWRGGVVAQIAAALLGAANHPVAVDTAKSIAPYLRDLEDAQMDEVRNELTTALGPREWWTGGTELAAQQRVHAVALALVSCDDVDVGVADAVHATLLEDLKRVVQPVAQPGQLQPTSPLVTVPGLSAVRELAVPLVAAGSLDLLDDLRAVVSTVDAAVDAEAARTILRLAATSAEHGNEVDLCDEAALVEALASGVDGAPAAADWLAVDPDGDTVAAIAAKLGDPALPSLGQSVSDWAARSDESDRTAVVLRLLETATPPVGWVERVARHGVDDIVVVNDIARRISDAPQHEQRGELISFLLAVAPSGRAAHVKVAEVMLELLKRDTKVDFDHALRAAGALGTDHQHGEKLRQALDDATQRNDYRIPRKALDALHAAGIRPKQRSLTETARDAWKSLIGGGRRR